MDGTLSEARNRPTSLGRRALRVGLALAGVTLLVMCVLMFGDPQWCRWCFIFQAYVLPGDPPRPTADYSGTWLAWHRNGTKAGEVTYEDGQRHGREVGWDGHGRKRWEFYYQKGRRHGSWTEWDEQGSVRARGTYSNDEPWQGTCYAREGEGWVATYRQGKPWFGAALVESELRFYANGKVIGVYRGSEPWEGIFLDWDDSGETIVERAFRKGDLVRQSSWNGALILWDDSTQAFVEKLFRGCDAGHTTEP